MTCSRCQKGSEEGDHHARCLYCQGTGKVGTMNVVKHGNYYYVQLGAKGEGGPYYFEMYQDRRSADATISGLTDWWAGSPSVFEQDYNTLFIHLKHKVRLCQIERAYIEKYGRDPWEADDNEARRKGFKYRIKIGTEGIKTQMYLYDANQAGPMMRELYPDDRILETIEL